MKILSMFPGETRLKRTRPYTNHAVRFKKEYTAEERLQALQNVGWNVFLCPSRYVTGCDLLSDSGTTTMTNHQWALLHEGDEAYGSNEGYFRLGEVIQELWGETFFSPNTHPPNAFLFHQGRAGEDSLFTHIGKLGKNMIIPSNGHFDTTGANIEANGMQALNLFSPELHEDSHEHFKGNIDLRQLAGFLKLFSHRIPLIYLTITNNTGGGQPVSMKNIRKTRALARRYQIPLFFDAGRFAENAWFIKQDEEGYHDKSIRAIVREMFEHADGCTVSFKKDGLGNSGGGVFIKRDGLFEKRYSGITKAMVNHQILTEGHPTYGGMSGRDIMTIVEGLRQATEPAYLDHRIGQVRQFGIEMMNAFLPVLTPFGGHAVYLDMNRFFKETHHRPEDFGGIAFAALLLGCYGHRVSELGNFAFGKYNPIGNWHEFPENNFVRFAVPRLKYEEEDLAAVVDATKALYEKRERIPKVKVINGLDLPLRHFHSRFELLS